MLVNKWGIITIIIVNMYYLLDSTSTLLIRLKKEDILKAHSNHFYQKMIRKGYQHSFVIKWIFGLNLFS